MDIGETLNRPADPDRLRNAAGGFCPASPLIEIAKLFLRLGATSFGGPVAHIAMMHDETVQRRKWLDDGAFLDLVGATNLIPGPNSTEMVIHLGQLRGGWRGLWLAGACFIAPAMLIVLAVAAVYARYGTLPAAQWLLYGIKPVVIAIVAQALWALGRKALTGWMAWGIGLAVFAGYVSGMNEIALLFGAGFFRMAAVHIHRTGNPLLALVGLPVLAPGAPGTPAVPFSLFHLFLVFLKIGSVLYGSGYVLLAFLRADFVVRLGWLTDAQILDAIAIGQVTPGPVFTAATFIGYLLGGVPGALLATLAIFLPSFLFVGLLTPLLPRMRKSVWLGALLDGVNAASLALMAAVALQLGRASLIDPLTVLLGMGSLILLLRFKLNSAWLVAGGALAGCLNWILRS